MWILEEGQILPYLRSHYPVFDQSGPVDIQCIGALEGEEKPREPDEGGLINYIFRVSNGKQSVIVKQGRSASRKNDKIVLPIWRNRQEYETLRRRHAIVPQYTPETYYVDGEMCIRDRERAMNHQRKQSMRKNPVEGRLPFGELAFSIQMILAAK